MWDLTIPGDHDFYIDTVAAPVLVHNCAELRRYQGGVYTLRDEAGNVVRTGQSGNLYERQLAHARDPVLGQFRFQIEYLTNDLNERMGLEQMLYERYPVAQVANGGFNARRAVDPSSSDYQTYMQAARHFLARQGGG